MFEFEYGWLLILPIFFSLGWIAARIDLRQLVRESRSLPNAYFQGLTHLLNHENEKAVEALTEAAQEHQTHFELVFALGQLHRNRGQFDKAIYLHQTLAARADLQAEQRLAARLALAQDYLKAGLYDRAESGLKDLIDTTVKQNALQNLLELMQRERRWLDAIHIAQDLEKQNHHSYYKECAEFYCELAQNALQKEDYSLAKTSLDNALEINRLSVRARYLKGKLAFVQRDWDEAITVWQSIQNINASYIGLIASLALEAYCELGKTSTGFTWLKSISEEAPTVDLIDALIPVYIEQEGFEATQSFLYLAAKKLPILSIVLQYWRCTKDLHEDTSFEWMRKIFETLVERSSVFVCNQCGFKAQQFYWQCPACLSWESYLPYRLEELHFHTSNLHKQFNIT